ncbi:hypothetical protein [Natronolimnohabitans innermongolicus]|uniref:hypothetical protein n=1 Tax=Natronolimnohabitans innermongolicus TaxID=253107 RepID=UPI001F4C7578|nr:hypothetical protein [Natronolimnohabitans innermongolicus]
MRIQLVTFDVECNRRLTATVTGVLDRRSDIEGGVRTDCDAVSGVDLEVISVFIVTRFFILVFTIVTLVGFFLTGTTVSIRGFGYKPNGRDVVPVRVGESVLDGIVTSHIDKNRECFAIVSCRVLESDAVVFTHHRTVDPIIEHGVRIVAEPLLVLNIDDDRLCPRVRHAKKVVESDPLVVSDLKLERKGILGDVRLSITLVFVVKFDVEVTITSLDRNPVRSSGRTERAGTKQQPGSCGGRTKDEFSALHTSFLRLRGHTLPEWAVDSTGTCPVPT